MAAVTDTAILLLVSAPILRSVVKETLEHAGYSVFAAGDLGTAVDKLKESKPDLLMISPYVEDMSGYDAATYLRTKCPGVRVLVLSGLMDDDRIQNRLTIQGFEVFPTPFTAAELVEKVKAVLQKAG
ncbi:MAG TPA: response regulator [Candidatus Acidoferrales bacterium]|jgi:DNA-binding response OmpR family regulator|nr:response regulator [Candidatus Acidoferrales bacterium]